MELIQWTELLQSAVKAGPTGVMTVALLILVILQYRSLERALRIIERMIKRKP